MPVGIAQTYRGPIAQSSQFNERPPIREGSGGSPL